MRASDTHPLRVPGSVEVRKSRIDGRGAFATIDLPARLRVGVLDGEVISIRASRRRVAQTARVQMVEINGWQALDASVGTSPLRFVNHACRPNVYMRISAQFQVEFYALRAIRAGEELTVRYGLTHHEGALRCRCGMPGCARWL